MAKENMGSRSGTAYDVNGNEVQVDCEIDKVSGNRPVIRSDHKYIHDGKGFSAEFADLNLGQDEIISLELVTPSEKYVHFKNILVEDALVRIYEIPESVDRSSATQKNTNQSK